MNRLCKPALQKPPAVCQCASSCRRAALRIAGLAGLRRAAFVTLSIADPPAKPCDGGIFGGLYALPEMCSRKKEQNQTKAAPRLRFFAGASLASACAKAWP